MTKKLDRYADLCIWGCQTTGQHLQIRLLQEVVKIDPDKENADTVAKQKLAERSKASETFSFEMIEAVNSYTRAGMILSVDDTDYLIDSAQHSIKNDVHYVKVDLMKFG